jgi:tellurite resistance protein
VQGDWRNPFLSPFLALVVIVPTFLAGALCEVNLAVGRVFVAVLSFMTIAVGGWSTGQWILNDLYDECMPRGYLVPMATGGFVGSIAASDALLHLLAKAWFGVGMVSWLLVVSIILNRLFIRPRLPQGLTPTLALEAGPPMVAGVAYHALHGGPMDTFAAALGGYAITMVVVQLRLVPIYVRLPFSPALVVHVPCRRDRLGRNRVAPDGATCRVHGLDGDRAWLRDAGSCQRCHAVRA